MHILPVHDMYIESESTLGKAETKGDDAFVSWQTDSWSNES